jgi:VWFA-related protein
MKYSTTAALLLATAAAGAVIAAQQPAPDPPVPHTVRIDVVLSDARGRVVDTLKPADFDLTEDGMSQPIESVRLVRVDPTRQGASSPETTRLFAIYLDEYHITAGPGVARAKAALARFVTQELGPQDLLIVMKPLESLFDIHLTHDRETAAHVIEGLIGRRGDYTPRNDYEKNSMVGDNERIETARDQVVLSALNALAVNLGPLGDGRKNVIVVTEAIGRPPRRRGQEYLATLENAMRSATRSNTSMYVVDPREAPPEVTATGREAMQLLAGQTGGLLIDGNLDEGLQRVSREASAYYLLTYRSAHPENGAFHPVRVRVARPGVKVRARAGYWAPSADDALRAELVAQSSAEPKPPPKPEPPRRLSPLIQPWFGLARGDKGKTRVTFVWEPAARVPGDRARRAPSRIQLTALGSDDTTVFQGPILPAGSTAAKELEGAAARAVFDAPPGRLRLQMKIEDGTLQLDTDVRDISLRDWRSAVAIGTPEVLRSRNALEFRALDGNPDATPVASREFSRTERLIIRFPTYAPSGAQQTITAKLLGRTGQMLRELPVQTSATTDGRHRIDLVLAALAPGEYLIELGAKCQAGEAKDRFAFRVTN